MTRVGGFFFLGLLLLATVPAVNSFYGVNGHYFQGGPYNANLAQQVKDMQNVGFSSMRLDVFDVTQFRTLVDTVIPSLSPIVVQPILNMWLNVTNENDAYNQSWAVGYAAGQALGCVVPMVELLNEPDTAMYQAGYTIGGNGQNPSDYTAGAAFYRIVRGMLRGMYDGFKAGDPIGQTKIAGPSFSWLHTGFSDMLWNGEEPDGSTGHPKLTWDVTNWHWYFDMGNITDAGDTYDNVLAYLQSAYGKPIQVSEIGVQFSQPETVIDDYITSVVAQYAEMKAKYDLQGINWYELYDFSPMLDNPAQYMGIYNTTGIQTTMRAATMKAAILAFQEPAQNATIPVCVAPTTTASSSPASSSTSAASHLSSLIWWLKWLVF